MSDRTDLYRKLLANAEAIDQCQALDQNGVKCRKRATTSNAYHGDHELYDTFNGKPTWVRVKLCDDHDLE